MRLSQFIEREPEIRRKKAKPRKAGIATHGAFLPILGLWGAALFGLSVLVLPESAIGRLVALSNGAVTGAAARLTFAGIAAVLGTLAALVFGGALRSAALRRDSNHPIVAALNVCRVEVIDPVRELGSSSLDAPLGEAMLADDADIAEFEPLAPGAAQADTASTDRDFQPDGIENDEGASVSPIVRKPAQSRDRTRERSAAAPREIGLEEFGRLPGRNAVWVEEEAGEPAAPRPARPTRPAPVPASALQKLRQTPTDRLSLVEMVERFAGALHEHQRSERARRPGSAASRDAALVEALKALDLFTQEGFDRPAAAASGDEQLGRTERELRDALAKLQRLRGAA